MIYIISASGLIRFGHAYDILLILLRDMKRTKVESYKSGREKLYFRVSCLTGLLLSTYALFVELRVEQNDKYEAFCDLHENISCTKAFSSEYGKGFGVVEPIFGKNSILNQPNSLFGIIFYLVLMLMSFSESKVLVKSQLILCIISNILTIYLAYILYFILHNLCVLCVGTYVVNAVNLILSIRKWKIVKHIAKLKLKD